MTTLESWLSILAMILVSFVAAVSVPHLAANGRHRLAVALVLAFLLLLPAGLCLALKAT